MSCRSAREIVKSVKWFRPRKFSGKVLVGPARMGRCRCRQQYLSKEFFGGDDSVLDVKVKMIYDGKEGDIINQYVAFTKIYNEQVKLHGRTREAVLETIRICKDQNVLSEYLSSREKEVVDIMMTLFNEEYILKTYVESREKEASEKTKIGTAQKLYKKGNSIEDIADTLDVSVKEVEQWLGLVGV